MLTLKQMNSLYQRGLYSTIDYYQGLFAHLKDGMDLDVAMGEIAQPLLRRILELAGRHQALRHLATDEREAAITDAIYEWGKSHATKPRSEPARPKSRRQTAKRRAVGEAGSTINGHAVDGRAKAKTNGQDVEQARAKPKRRQSKPSGIS